jgi:hypothetical protein
MVNFRPLLVMLVLLLLAAAGVARADIPLMSTGPSVSFGRLGFEHDPEQPGADKPTFRALAAGAGWTLRFNPPQLVSKDGRIAYMSWDLTALAQLATLPLSGGMSLATGPSFYNGLIGIQVGCKLFEFSEEHEPEGVLLGAGGRRNLFFLVSLSTNLTFLKDKAAAKSATSVAERAPANYIRVASAQR